MKRTDQTSRHFGQRVVVAIPAKNEADWIGRCLDALAQQTRQADAVLVLLNNCTDGIAGIAHAYAAVARFPLLVECRTLPTSTASAGSCTPARHGTGCAACGAGWRFADHRRRHHRSWRLDRAEFYQPWRLAPIWCAGA